LSILLDQKCTGGYLGYLSRDYLEVKLSNMVPVLNILSLFLEHVDFVDVIKYTWSGTNAGKAIRERSKDFVAEPQGMDCNNVGQW
jgi:hypothetical protein